MDFLPLPSSPMEEEVSHFTRLMHSYRSGPTVSANCHDDFTGGKVINARSGPQVYTVQNAANLSGSHIKFINFLMAHGEVEKNHVFLALLFVELSQFKEGIPFQRLLLMAQALFLHSEREHYLRVRKAEFASWLCIFLLCDFGQVTILLGPQLPYLYNEFFEFWVMVSKGPKSGILRWFCLHCPDSAFGR